MSKIPVKSKKVVCERFPEILKLVHSIEIDGVIYINTGCILHKEVQINYI